MAVAASRNSGSSSTRKRKAAPSGSRYLRGTSTAIMLDLDLQKKVRDIQAERLLADPGTSTSFSQVLNDVLRMGLAAYGKKGTA